LEELALCITNEQIEDVSTVLAQNCTLRKLILYTSSPLDGYSLLMDEVDQRWLDFSDVLRNPSSALESLSLGVNIDDNIINSFTDALVTNSRLKRLSLYGKNSITTEGWVIFSAFLRNPNSNLEELCFNTNHINDTVMNSFADALTINSKLRELNIEHLFDDDDNDDDNDPNPLADNIITSIGYDALTCMMCNKRSILSTFNSNHSLEKIILDIFAYDDDDDDDEEEEEYEDEDEQLMAKLPIELKTLLQINKENNKSQAARLKIINTHFSGNDINMEPFMKMDVNVRPHAIAWMAKDMHVYQFLRAMPLLLEKVEDEGHMVG
jgi:hypothetical protein